MLKAITINDPQLRATLWTGRMQTEEGEKIAILKMIRQEGEKEFIFELKNSECILRPHFLKRVLITTRSFSLTAVISPGLVVLGTGIFFEGWKAHPLLFVTSLMSVMFLQIAVNVFNDVQDHLKGVDLPGDLGGSGVIQKAWFSARAVSRMGIISLLLALSLSYFPLRAYLKELLALALTAFVGSIGYSGLGLALKYRALGDFAVFFLCGPLLVTGFSIATFGRLSPSLFFTGVIFGLAAVGILHANNLGDLEVDNERGARTIANQIGFKWSQKYFAAIYGMIFLICVLAFALLRTHAALFLAPLIVSPLAYRLVRKVKNATGPLSPSITKIRFEAAQFHMLIGLAFALSLLTKL